MSRKERAALPTMADRFFEWLDQRAERSNDPTLFHSISDADGNWAPGNHWEIDSFAPMLREDLQPALYVMRREVVVCFHATVGRAEELYRRREEAEVHRKRAREARALVQKFNRFLAGRAVDLPALGVRGDYRHFRDPQIAPDREGDALDEWRELLAIAPRLSTLLNRFADDRDQLMMPPTDKTDLLGMIFARNIEYAADRLFGPRTNADLTRFALAAWRDLGMPLPDRKEEPASSEAWIEWMGAKIDKWQRLPAKKKGAIAPDG